MGAPEPLYIESLDLTDRVWLAMQLDAAEYRKRHSPTRRRDALIARWKASKASKPPPPPAAPSTWTADDRKAWEKYASRADVRAFLADVAEIGLDDPAAVAWWFGLTDRERFDLEHVSHKAIRDEFTQSTRRRAWRAAGRPTEAGNFDPDQIAVG